MPLEVELDLSGKFYMGICPNRVWGEKEDHAILGGGFKNQEDLEMYGQVPDYGEFHRYDMRIDSESSQVGEKIYADFHKPSWQTPKRHLFLAGIPQKLSRHLKILAGGDKKDEFK